MCWLAWRVVPTGCCNAGMAIHPGVEATSTRPDRLEVVESVRSRLADLAGRADLDQLLDDALDRLLPSARVTTYLPILVEREVRDQVRHRV